MEYADSHALAMHLCCFDWFDPLLSFLLWLQKLLLILFLLLHLFTDVKITVHHIVFRFLCLKKEGGRREGGIRERKEGKGEEKGCREQNKLTCWRKRQSTFKGGAY